MTKRVRNDEGVVEYIKRMKIDPSLKRKYIDEVEIQAPSKQRRVYKYWHLETLTREQRAKRIAEGYDWLFRVKNQYHIK